MRIIGLRLPMERAVRRERTTTFGPVLRTDQLSGCYCQRRRSVDSGAEDQPFAENLNGQSDRKYAIPSITMAHDDNSYLVISGVVVRHIEYLRAEGLSIVSFDMWSLRTVIRKTEMIEGRFLFALELRQYSSLIVAKARYNHLSFQEAGRIIRRFIDESYRAR
jgi:hypothetical protein